MANVKIDVPDRPGHKWNGEIESTRLDDGTYVYLFFCACKGQRHLLYRLVNGSIELDDVD